ncbi:MAG: ubiquitin-activating E1 FCCH domain-containing protein [Hyphomonas sp.]|jgi:Flp pilus assembly protein TadG
MGNWGKKFWAGNLLGRFARGERGNVAIIAALAIIPLVTVAGFALDFQMTVTKKSKVQYAVDGAVLSAVKSLEQNLPREDVIVEANTYFREILGIENDTFLDCSPLNLTFAEDNEELEASVYCTNETTLSKIAGKQYLEFTVSSAATYGMGSLEVALILDVTGSMAGSRINALKLAATDFIDIVIQDVQVPFYSKASIVPYSVAINAGPYAEEARGPVLPGKAITNAVWQSGTTVRNITGITRANPAVVTSAGHGYVNGDIVWISGVSGMTQANNKAFTVAGATANTFQLQGTNSSSWSNYSSGGQIRKCLNAGCAVTVTSNSHGFNNGDLVVITDVNGMTGLNTGTHVTWTVSNRTANTFVATGSVGPTAGTYTNGGSVWCTTPGCRFYRFLNKASNAQRVHEISTCVTERIGADALNDRAPTSSLVGRNYPSTSNPCPAANTILPLTSNKTDLKNKINALSATGSTAGHLGAAWGWYTLSPNWGYMFPVGSRPGEYNQRSLFKVAVLMTDGEYNSAYCNGVIAGNSTSGSGSTADQINCNATNGHSFDQALAYCAAMKNSGFIIYTIGFEVVSDPRATQLVNQCASTAGHAYMASGAAQLREVFQAIARSINEVRLTR